MSPTIHFNLDNMLQVMKDPIFRKAWQELVMDDYENLIQTTLDGYKRICSEPFFTFFHLWETAQGYTHLINCTLTSVPQDYFKAFGHLLLQAESPYTKGIDY